MANHAWGLAGAAFLPLCVRLLLLPWWPVPAPYISDEFSYLLAADTYAHGRLSTPQHPLWQHFESINILTHPAYVSKYPPGQGMFLALGQVVFHSPWAGVCVEFGVLCAALYWSLIVIVGRRWAFAGALVAGFHLMPGYWLNSYWGGALPAFAGAVALGAALRQNGWLAGIGIGLLAITRPVEGLIFALALLLVLRPRAMVRTAPAIACALAFTAYQDWVILGDPFHLPYLEAARQTQVAPAFIWEGVRQGVIFVDPYLEFNYARYQAQLVSGPYLLRLLIKVLQSWTFFAGPALTVSFLFARNLRRDRRLRAIWPILGASILTLLITTAFFPHYQAPYLVVFVALMLQAFRRMSAARPQIAWATFSALCVTIAAGTFLAVFQERDYTLGSPPGWCCMQTIPWPRFQVIDQVGKLPLPQLLIVRYGMHEPVPAWIYNPADIDAAKVIFARDYGACGNRDLLRYYSNRQKWLLEVDGFEYTLTPYPEHESCAG